MEMQLHWCKKWHESQFQLFLHDQQIGEISPVVFSRKAIACLYGEKYIFRPKGILLRKIEISDAGTHRLLGKICFMGLGIHGVILLNAEEAFQLRCKNIFAGRWTISRSRKELIRYTGTLMKGKIQSDWPGHTVLLAGLYAGIFQWRKFILLIVILIPLIVIFIRTI